MAVSIPRLRIWFAVMALATVAVVAGFYVEARFAMRIALKKLPGKLGIDIQQTSEGSRSPRARADARCSRFTLPRLRNSKQGGRAELHDVNIIVYGRKSDRFDQIYGNDFEYDRRREPWFPRERFTSTWRATPKARSWTYQAPPREMHNPIHLRTEGMVFNQKTGLAETEGRDRFPGAPGHGNGGRRDLRFEEERVDAALRHRHSDHGQSSRSTFRRSTE